MTEIKPNYARENLLLLDSENLTYNDILLKPRKGILNSRSDADISNFRIFTAPMDTVLDSNYNDDHPNLVKVLPREETFKYIKRNLPSWSMFKGASLDNFVFSFGGSDNDMDVLDLLLTYKKPKGIMIDVAHGHSDHILKVLKRIREEFHYEGDLISGSIATEEGAYDSIQAGANILRVGIGGGQMCTTRLVTGCGVPNITAIQEARRGALMASKDFKIIADGGIKEPGDIPKALTVGADYVMIGTGFSNCSDSAAKLVDGHKIQRGQASEEYQIEYLGKVRNGAAEGVSRKLPLDSRTIVQKTEYYLGGLRSAISYLGLSSSDDINIKNVKILKCTPTVMLENRPMD